MLFSVSLFAISLMGQSTIKGNRTEGQRDEAFKILKQIAKNNANLANPIYSPSDTKQAMDSLIYEGYYEFDGGWRNSIKEEYIWGENEKEILMTNSTWMVEDNYWLAFQITDYTYNNDGKLFVERTKTRESLEMEWFNQYKTEYSYQGTGGISAIMSMWDTETSQWLMFWKFDILFNDNGRVEEILLYINEEMPVNWLDYEKYEYLYNDDGNAIQEFWYIWDEDTNDWFNDYKVDYLYEDNGNLINEIWYFRNGITLTWENESKDEYAFDDYGNISETIYSWWESNINDWLVDEKSVYTYNNSFTYNDLLLPNSFLSDALIYEGLLYNHMLLTEEVFEAWDDAWDNDSRTTYYYSEYNPSSVDENGDSHFVVYPNPATGFFSIDLNSGSETVLVEVFDACGRRVLLEEIVENQPISVSHLDKGVYVYKFVFNEKAFSGKLLVQ